MAHSSCILLAVLSLGLLASAHLHEDLADRYSNFKLLSSPSYELYWDVDEPSGNLSLAVRVNTTGWVGFGVSPNGGMPNSDVVMGWVEDDGTVVFQDRCAVRRDEPVVEPEDLWNWHLVRGSESGGWTTLEFWRLLGINRNRPCDISIEKGVTSLIYAWGDSDPVGAASFHKSQRGTQGIALLPSDEIAADLNESESFLLTVKNITIPGDDTTYWCHGFRLPETIRNEEKHMIRFEPFIHEPASPHVHHILIYECGSIVDLSNFTDEQLKGGPCYTDPSVLPLTTCMLRGSVVAGWAVGGEAFDFPADVSLSFGGPSASSVWVMEMHYDNPAMKPGVIDQSGMKITYLSKPRTHNAGIALVGHGVTPLMITPPALNEFTVVGNCHSNCTEKVLPEDGITVFANILHTHVAGTGLTLKHMRGNQEILPPLDQDLKYDFNFQQFRYITPRKLLPGDSLQLECFYSTSNRNTTLLGGLGTNEEMCVSFFIHYPRSLQSCYDSITSTALQPFLKGSGLTPERVQQIQFNLFQFSDYVRDHFSTFQWNQTIVDDLQALYYEGDRDRSCQAFQTSTISTDDGEGTTISTDEDLADRYSNFKLLSSPSYELYWDVDEPSGNLSLAVRVNTTGWVGFGVSPNGGMPNSDVVMGWVEDDGTVVFQDRCAVGRYEPVVEPEDLWNWHLVRGSESGGWTTLEFWRLLGTNRNRPCDISIEKGVTSLIYAWGDSDPVGAASFHKSQRGTQGIALLPSDEIAADLNESESFLLTVKNITIPGDDTTYWCHGFRLPETIRNEEKHMIRFEPFIHEPASPHVHHILIYECGSAVDLSNFTDEQLKGGPCYTDPSVVPLTTCLLRGTVVAGWAVGGEAFDFPADVSLSFGGPSASSVWVMEMHYDNPAMKPGVIDQSGMKITYLSKPRTHNAGIALVGHGVTPLMITPPALDEFTVVGNCHSDCTEKVLPEDGITVFANILHTHVAGTGLTLKHMRGNQEILPPLDQDLKYDFNFQQFRYITPRKLLPGDSLQLECFYSTSNRNTTLLGGLGTNEEMCVSFFIHYPRSLQSCYDSITSTALQPFLKGSGLTPERVQQIRFNLFLFSDFVRDHFSTFQWNQTIVDDLQALYYDADHDRSCQAFQTSTISTDDGEGTTISTDDEEGATISSGAGSVFYIGTAFVMMFASAISFFL